MDISFFFAPAETGRARGVYPLKPQTYGQLAEQHAEGRFPDWENADVVIFGCTETRGGIGGEGCGETPDAARDYFYQLSAPDSGLRVADLGNLVAKENLEDVYFMATYIAGLLLRQDKKIVVLAATQELTYAIYQAYEQLETHIEYVAIDNTPDIFDAEVAFNSSSVNYSIIAHAPNYLRHFSVLGAQSYLLTQEETDILESMNFECARVGYLREDIRRAEPPLRTAQLASFDLSAVRLSEAPGTTNGAPGGLTTEEACQLARFAGSGYHCNCIAFSEADARRDPSGLTARLAALLVWHYIEGARNRPADYPAADRRNLQRYRVSVPGGLREIVFYLHPQTRRWWMEVPSPRAARQGGGPSALVPCSESDYKHALQEEIPLRWELFHHKFEE